MRSACPAGGSDGRHGIGSRARRVLQRWPGDEDGVVNRRRMGWMGVVLLVPLLGPILYYVIGRSPILRSLRTMLVAGGLGIYFVIAALAIVAGGS
jgi:phospholipase D-like protein